MVYFSNIVELSYIQYVYSSCAPGGQVLVTPPTQGCHFGSILGAKYIFLLHKKLHFGSKIDPNWQPCSATAFFVFIFQQKKDLCNVALDFKNMLLLLTSFFAYKKKRRIYARREDRTPVSMTHGNLSS